MAFTMAALPLKLSSKQFAAFECCSARAGTTAS
jgi:hypothetical protein